MKIIPYNELLSVKNLKTVDSILKKNGIIIYPTDTLYGLGGHFFSVEVLEKIDKIKNRRGSPYSVAVAGLPMAKRLIESFPENFQDVFQSLLPGKFTLLLEASKSLNPQLLRGSKKIGIRIPGLTELRRLIHYLGNPLVSTSVNLQGEAPMNDPAQIIRLYSNSKGDTKIDLFIDAGILPESKGSTILDITKTPITCIREGDDYYKFINLIKRPAQKL